MGSHTVLYCNHSSIAVLCEYYYYSSMYYIVPACSILLYALGQIVSVGDPHKKYTKMEKIGQG